MRKLIVAAFVSLDGVMQGPGGPDEDRRGGFAHGGWVAPYSDAVTGQAVMSLFEAPFELLLGRRTYEIFAAHWPYQDPKHPIAERFNATTKHVASRDPEAPLPWENSRHVGPDAVEGVRRLKAGTGPDLLTQGSTQLVHALLAADLVDEMQLMVFPLLLGPGRRLFDEAAAPGAWTLTGSILADTGVVVNRYRRDGPVRTGSFMTQEPSAAELKRRAEWAGEA
ncbi:dihydrofolate reductase family protein [Caulobacter endophyticus]|uniref:dihydrofolate reductase family protein n=1 Tax=Caulobacter endophyticus TaxID=2172652 RepID=UPI002410AED3|nr:dihydrofolate reductase family protein [Caulobacter endophyticus]MDG2531213.1 dihydrofolate reductase family protein [Caulobacter endophyticus]